MQGWSLGSSMLQEAGIRDERNNSKPVNAEGSDIEEKVVTPVKQNENQLFTSRKKLTNRRMKEY